MLFIFYKRMFALTRAFLDQIRSECEGAYSYSEYFGSLLSFNSHINSIVSQSMRALGIMARLTKPFNSHHCPLRLYSTHVRSKLEFASVVWNNISSSASESI
uniref:Putative secreted protein n=1 Tax=Ixodes ricinus TaxID=34613 RepID=A0A6B0U9V2_IXORI